MRLLFIIICFTSVTLLAQEEDLENSILLDSIQAIGEVKNKIETDLKMTVSVDEYLASSESISFIKRGAYAWEPLLNNFTSERTVITIDGMHIFGACTDKMDPVTSYVESNNLAEVDIKSGQKGSLHGSSIAGSIDLKRNSTSFSTKNKCKKSIQSGFESNNMQLFNMANLSYATNKLAMDGSLSYRFAENYYDGKGEEVKHSQFHKLNASLGLAYKTGSLSSIKANLIFDKANDVGYPALPMDLWLSRALISSVTYKKLYKEGLKRGWETKIYFNAIEHYMDDTTRPENLVHMDMPGWSTTYGLQSKLNLKMNKYSSQLQLNAYNNLSIAEMTMYPQDRSHATMFAYTWPWVTTTYGSVAIDNTYALNDDSQVNFGGSLGVNYNYSKYAEFNRIFYPNSSQSKTRILPSLQANYHKDIKNIAFNIGAGYGHRAPSISEAYGYYIYNSFDRYDYIGNPNLGNEVSYELNTTISIKSKRMKVEGKANYFYIRDYIVGEIMNLGSPMNYQSIGVKGYTALDYATLFNLSVNAKYALSKNLHWAGVVTYARGKSKNNQNLPFIRPFSYSSNLHYGYRKLNIHSTMKGDFEQKNYSEKYGEDETPSYFLWDISTDYSFYISHSRITLQMGVENLLDEYYSTYADWGNIPRMGRNFFTSIKIKL